MAAWDKIYVIAADRQNPPKKAILFSNNASVGFIVEIRYRNDIGMYHVAMSFYDGETTIDENFPNTDPFNRYKLDSDSKDPSPKPANRFLTAILAQDQKQYQHAVVKAYTELDDNADFFDISNATRVPVEVPPDGPPPPVAEPAAAVPEYKDPLLFDPENPSPKGFDTDDDDNSGGIFEALGSFFGATEEKEEPAASPAAASPAAAVPATPIVEEAKKAADADNNENGTLDGTPKTKESKTAKIFTDSTKYLGKRPVQTYNERSPYILPGVGNSNGFYSGGALGNLRAVKSKLNIFQAGLYKPSKAPRKAKRPAFFTDVPLIQKPTNRSDVKKSLSRKSLRQIKRRNINAPTFISQVAANPKFMASTISEANLSNLLEAVIQAINNGTSLQIPYGSRELTKADNEVIQAIGTAKSIPAKVLGVFVTCLKYLFYAAAGTVTVGFLIGWETLKTLRDILSWIKWLIDKICAYYGVTLLDVIKEMLKKVVQLVWSAMKWGIGIALEGMSAIMRMLYNIGVGFWNNWTHMPPDFNDLPPLNETNSTNTTNTSGIPPPDDDDNDDNDGDNMDDAIRGINQTPAGNSSLLDEDDDDESPKGPQRRARRTRFKNPDISPVLNEPETVNPFKTDNIHEFNGQYMHSDAFKQMSRDAAEKFIKERAEYTNNTFDFEGYQFERKDVEDILEDKENIYTKTIEENYTGGGSTWNDWYNSFINSSGDIVVTTSALIWGVATYIWAAQNEMQILEKAFTG